MEPLEQLVASRALTRFLGFITTPMTNVTDSVNNICSQPSLDIQNAEFYTFQHFFINSANILCTANIKLRITDVILPTVSAFIA